mmetsp:Transcript_16949/g.31357  ORF Transcript_16949/g.31357 Transcript_16949/m.31357 type:complete len:228 (-) Transcript_16949:52-735(-)
MAAERMQSSEAQAQGLPTEISGSNKPAVDDSQRIDQITALQDSIDSLSLSMFEALRGLRDAVAPESGNLGGGQESAQNSNNNNSSTPNNNNNENSENDFEEFWQSYRNGDPEIVALVQKVSPAPPKKREDYIRIHAKVEMEKDTELVKKLAETVLEKSADIDRRVSKLPGMHRTRAEQMKYIEGLLEKNCQAASKLEETYQIAQERRDRVRKFVRDHTCEALGILED